MRPLRFRRVPRTRTEWALRALKAGSLEGRISLDTFSGRVERVHLPGPRARWGRSTYWLDLTALGRQEECKEPKGRAASARADRPDFAD